MQRRNFLKITAGLGVAAFAAACSKQETAPIEQAATSAASSSAAEQHQRVIALNTGQLDNLLMLRILPVGAAKAKNLGVVSDYIRNRFGSDFDLDSIADCGLRADPDLETIASLKPTLIALTRVRTRPSWSSSRPSRLSSPVRAAARTGSRTSSPSPRPWARKMRRRSFSTPTLRMPTSVR